MSDDFDPDDKSTWSFGYWLFYLVGMAAVLIVPWPLLALGPIALAGQIWGCCSEYVKWGFWIAFVLWMWPIWVANFGGTVRWLGESWRGENR